MKMLNTFVIVGALAMSAPAFAKDTKNAAKKTDAKAAAQSTTLKVDPSASEVKWAGSKKLVNTVHHGTLKVKDGEIMLNGEQITGGTINLDMTSINDEDLADPKDKAKLEGHLKSPDFFDVEKNPTATFKITSAKPVKDSKDGLTHQVTGDLTIKGKTSPVTIPVTIKREGDKAEASGKAVVDRTKYDVRYGSGKFFDNLGDKVINDEIKLDIKVVASK
jgi:polyisoprenoid-binding protein YceI